MKQPDWKRLLSFFQEHEGQEVNAYTQIVIGMRILEYTGRITDLRKKLGCTCASGISCTSSKHIVNTRKGYYRYTNDFETVTRKEQTVIDLSELKRRRDGLRNEYREAKASGNELSMKVIEARGRALTLAIEKEEKKDLIKKTLF